MDIRSNGNVNGDSGSSNPSSWRDSTFELEEHSIDHVRELKVAVVGAGISGILAGVLLPAKVPNIRLTIFEKNPEVGGTWYENVYPGVRCDIPAHVYQTSFEPNTQWSEEFATGPELLEYWKYIARKFNVYDYLKLQHRVTNLTWDEERSKWIVRVTDLGSSRDYEEDFDFVLPAIGRFNDWKMPDYPGMDEFRGVIGHTSNWPVGYDYRGKDVALIGNGASGIQLLPTLQEHCHRIDHYARSPTWVARSWAGDERTWEPQYFSEKQLNDFKDPATYLKYRKKMEDKYWRGFGTAFRGSEKNKARRDDFVDVMKKRLEKKPELVDRIVPSFAPHCRRPTPGPGYLEALCEDNVEYICEPILKFTEKGIQTEDGTIREVDAVFCATGANVDLVPPFPIVSRGVDLKEAWRRGGKWGFPYNYLSLAVPEFPNLLIIYGPQAGGLSGQVVVTIENQVTTIAKILRKVSGEGIKTIMPSKAATDEFTEWSETFFRRTVLTDQCRSWYNGGVKGGRVFGVWPGSAAHANAARRDLRWEDWEYTYHSSNRFAYLGNGWTEAEKDPNSDMTFYLKKPEEVDLSKLHE